MLGILEEDAPVKLRWGAGRCLGEKALVHSRGGAALPAFLQHPCLRYPPSCPAPPLPPRSSREPTGTFHLILRRRGLLPGRQESVRISKCLIERLNSAEAVYMEWGHVCDAFFFFFFIYV